MKKFKPLFIAFILTIILHIGIIPWAAIQGTLEIAPLYLLWTVPIGAVMLIIGLVVSLLWKRAS